MDRYRVTGRVLFSHADYGCDCDYRGDGYHTKRISEVIRATDADSAARQVLAAIRIPV